MCCNRSFTSSDAIASMDGDAVPPEPSANVVSIPACDVIAGEPSAPISSRSGMAPPPSRRSRGDREGSARLVARPRERLSSAGRCRKE